MTYLLSGTSGSWDSHHNFIVGIYDSMELAENEKARIIKELTIIKSKYTPEKAKELELEYREIFFSSDFGDDEEIIYPEHIKEYMSWSFRYKHSSINLDKFSIKELEINKPANIKNFI